MKRFSETETDLNCILADKLNDFLDLPEQQNLTATTGIFQAWLNEMQNLTYLLANGRSESDVYHHWEERMLQLQKLFVERFELCYRNKALTELPPQWMASQYKNFKQAAQRLHLSR